MKEGRGREGLLERERGERKIERERKGHTSRPCSFSAISSIFL